MLQSYITSQNQKLFCWLVKRWGLKSIFWSIDKTIHVTCRPNKLWRDKISTIIDQKGTHMCNLICIMSRKCIPVALPLFWTGLVLYTSDISWPWGSRESMLRCVHRGQTVCPASGPSRPCTPPGTPGHSSVSLCSTPHCWDYRVKQRKVVLMFLSINVLDAPLLWQQGKTKESCINVPQYHRLGRPTVGTTG